MTSYSSIGCRNAWSEDHLPRLTHHLVPAADWPGLIPGALYRHHSLEDEGFIHCTDGRNRAVETANRYFQGDRRLYLLVTLDLDRVGCAWRYDDAAEVYPHVYGPIPVDAVVSVEDMRRSPEGRFLLDHEM
ncbi:MAG: DUF952 domain-containing protein [Dehalococcoidia bacterium]